MLLDKVSEEQRAIDPHEPIIHEPVVDVPLPPHRSCRISRPPERYTDMLTEEVKFFFLWEIGVMVMILIPLMR